LINRLPTAREIDPYKSWESRYAAEDFLGKTLEQAEALFATREEGYYESLIHMGPIGFCYYIDAALAYADTPRASRDIECLLHLSRVIEERLESDPEQIAPVVPILVEFCNTRGARNESDDFKALALNLQRLSGPPAENYPAPVVVN
jgi:hypothetical protein